VGEALLNRGGEVINIPIKTGEFSSANSKIESICLEHKDKNIIFVFVLQDNLAYYGQRDDNSLHASFSDKKGKFHVEGRLVLATKTLLHQHMKELAKTMTYCGSCQKYLLGPFPRYLLDRCCDNNKHITNLDDDDYISYQIGSCKDTSRAVRKLCFTCGVRKNSDPESTRHDGRGRRMCGRARQGSADHVVGGRPCPPLHQCLRQSCGESSVVDPE
jgi:hypothetical protein